jgi:hypothetical protein
VPPGQISITGPLGTGDYGPCGGGLGFNNVTWTLSNIGGQPIDWNASWTGGVMGTVNINPPTSGTLGPGESTSVTAVTFSINATAMSFTMSFYQNGGSQLVGSFTVYCT